MHAKFFNKAAFFKSAPYCLSQTLHTAEALKASLRLLFFPKKIQKFLKNEHNSFVQMILKIFKMIKSPMTLPFASLMAKSTKNGVRSFSIHFLLLLQNIFQHCRQLCKSIGFADIPLSIMNNRQLCGGSLGIAGICNYRNGFELFDSSHFFYKFIPI